MNELNLLTGEPFDCEPKMHHGNAVSGASSVSLRQRNLLGLRGAMMGGGGKKLPYDYAVEYLYNDMPAYIDTGIASTLTTSFQFDGQFLGRGGSGLGTLVGTNSDNILIRYRLDTIFDCIWKNSGWNTYSNFSVLERHTFKLDKSASTVDGVATAFPKAATNDNEDSFKIFAYNEGNTSRQGYGRVYSFKIWDSDELVMSLIPCVKDGEPMMYDDVGGGFYGNAAMSGSLYAGPKV